jgi:hypothetical protein
MRDGLKRQGRDQLTSTKGEIQGLASRKDLRMTAEAKLFLGAIGVIGGGVAVTSASRQLGLPPKGVAAVLALLQMALRSE